MEKVWSIRLIRFATVFGVVGTFLGSHMSGSMDYSLRPIHAHFLLVGWLSVFAWGIFYKVYKIRYKRLVAVQSMLAMAGALGLTLGMWLYQLNPLNWNESFVMILFIIGGSLLLLAFFLFMINSFFIETDNKDKV